MTGMDSRYPASDRALTMIVTLLRGVEFTAEQIDLIGRSLPPIPRNGRKAKDRCIRNHARTTNNLYANGACVQCMRQNARLRQEFGRDRETLRAILARWKLPVCDCGHAKRKHDEGDELACYYVSDTGTPCECAAYRIVTAVSAEANR